MRERSPIQQAQAAERAELRRQEGERMERKGYGPGGRLARKTIAELHPREALIVEYAFRGCRIGRMCALVGREIGEPMTFEEAADILKIKRRKLAWLQTQKPFQQAVARELEAMKTGAQAGAMKVVIDLAHERGENKAADRKVMLQAAQAILGDKVGTPAQGSNVNVTVNNGPVLQAGIVVRLPPSAKAPPLEQATVIEGQAIERKAPPLREDIETMQLRCVDADTGG
jgi:hypothetical protein